MLTIEHIQAILDPQKQGVVCDGVTYEITVKDGSIVSIPISDIQETVSQFGSGILAIKQAIATNQAYFTAMTAFGAVLNTFIAQSPSPQPGVIPDVTIDPGTVDPILTP